MNLTYNGGHGLMFLEASTAHLLRGLEYYGKRTCKTFKMKVQSGE